MNPERGGYTPPIETKESEKNKGTLLGRVADIAMRALTNRFEVEGKENIPHQEALVVANHSSHIDGWALAAALKEHEFVIVVKDNASDPKAFNKLVRWIPTIGVRGVASHLPAEDMEALKSSGVFVGQVAARHEDPTKRREDVKYNLQALRTIVDQLASGKKVIYFPEGGFYKQGDKTLRQTTDGAVTIAKLFKRKTGRDLNMLPVGIEGGDSVLGSDPKGFGLKDVLKAGRSKESQVKVHVGQGFSLESDQDFSQVFNEKVGELLPDEYRNRG